MLSKQLVFCLIVLYICLSTALFFTSVYLREKAGPAVTPSSGQNLHGFPNVGITSFTKDESDTLSYWLRYHAILVGVQNIIVLDNFSTNPDVIALLEKWEKEKGLKVLWKQGPLKEKGRLQADAFKHFFPIGAQASVSSSIRRANDTSDRNTTTNARHKVIVDSHNRHRIFIPLDSDEFIVPVHNHRPILSACAFRHALQRLQQQYDATSRYHQYERVTCWKIEYFFNSLVHERNQTTMATLDTFRYTNKFIRKVIVHAQELVSMDIGHHMAELSQGICHPHHLDPPPPRSRRTKDSAKNMGHGIKHEQSSRHYNYHLSLLHFHTRTPLATITRAIYQSVAYGYLPKQATLENLHDYKRHLFALTNFTYTVLSNSSSASTTVHLNDSSTKTFSVNGQTVVYSFSFVGSGEHKLLELCKFLSFGEAPFYDPRPTLRYESPFVTGNYNRYNNDHTLGYKYNSTTRKSGYSSPHNYKGIAEPELSYEEVQETDFAFYNIEDIIHAMETTSCVHNYKNQNNH